MATLDRYLGERRHKSTIGARGWTSDPSPIPLADLDLLADLLDARWKVPGTSIRFGVDAIVGLFPVLGDAATCVASLYIVMRAREHGAGNGVIARMLGNVALDTIVGSIPILGSIFDVYYKTNKRNIRLLKSHLDRRRR
jgi:hypothetical protein